MTAGADASDNADRAVEMEWQFDALDLRPVERWLAALPVRTVGPSAQTVTALAKPGRRLVDHYLDTPDWRVGRAGFVLRTRRRGRHDEATLKDTRPADADGLRSRLEVTEPLTDDGVGGLGPDGPVGRRVHAVVGNRDLGQVVEVRTRRRPFSLRVGGVEVAELALDDTAIVVGAGQRPVHLRRIEVEVVPEWAAELTPLVEELRRTCGLQPATLSKYEAGLLALGIGVPPLPDLGSTEVSADSTTGELALAVLRRHTLVVLAREPGTRLGDDIEELHDMRVATRRLRAALDLFEGVLPVRARAVRDELRWLAAVLGAVRDLDVQLEHMAEMDAVAAGLGAPGDGHPLAEVKRLLEDQRRAARTELLAALDSPRWERLVASLTSLVTGPAARRPGSREPALRAVPDLVAERHRATVKAAKRARRSGLVTDYHRLRIRGKRLRYSLEFSVDLYGTRTTKFIRRLARLQDHLGLMQDAEVAVGRLLALATAPGDPLRPETLFAMGAVAERYRAEAEALHAGVPDVVKVLEAKEWAALRDLMEQRKAATPAPTSRVRRPPATTPAVGGLVPAAGGLDDPAVPADHLHDNAPGHLDPAARGDGDTGDPSETLEAISPPELDRDDDPKSPGADTPAADTPAADTPASADTPAEDPPAAPEVVVNGPWTATVAECAPVTVPGSSSPSPV